MFDGNHVLKIYMKIMLYSTFIIGAMTIINYEMYGEDVWLNLCLSRVDILLILCVQSFFIMIVFPVFKKTKDVHLALCNRKRLRFKLNNRVHWFVLVLLILETFFTIKTFNGIVGQTSTAQGSLISNIFNALKITAFMPIYYIAMRDGRRKIYWVNIVVWIIYELICGWTGVILEVAFIEFYLRVRENPNSYLTVLSYKLSGIFAIGVTLIGGFIYKYAWVLKNTIRKGSSVDKISYFAGLSKLVSRFTSFPLSVVAVQNHDEIVELYKLQGFRFADVIAILRPLLPRSIMPVKNFRTLNNIVIQSMYHDIKNTTSSDYGLVFMMHNLLSASFLDFIIYTIVALVCIIISKKIIYAFDDGTGKVDILYFFLVFWVLTGCSLESIFGYGYFGLIYLIPVMIILGLVKVTYVHE